jgi:hypothetical protein
MADIALVADRVNVIFPQSSEIIDVKLAEAVTRGQVVYQLTAGTFGVAGAAAAGKQQARGIALRGGAAGETISIAKLGFVSGYTVGSLNADVPIYLSNTLGALADGAGTMTVICGRVVALPDGVKVVYFNFDWLRAWV